MKAILFVLCLVALVIAFALWDMNGTQPVLGGILIALLWSVFLLSFDVLIPE